MDPVDAARVATDDDAAALEHLKWCWAEERGERTPSRAEHRRRMLRWIRERPDSHCPFVITASGRVVGMAWLAGLQRVPGSAVEIRRMGDVQSVFVLPAFRNGGAGTQLMECVVGHARETALEFLTVRPSRRSVNFYRRLGFLGEGTVLVLPLP